MKATILLLYHRYINSKFTPGTTLISSCLTLQGGDQDLACKTAESELKVTENALRENPKSYSAWHHRMWIMRKGLSSLSEELKQVNK